MRNRRVAIAILSAGLVAGTLAACGSTGGTASGAP